MNEVKRAEQDNFERLILVVMLLLVFIMAARTPVESDLFWHLSAGEKMLSTGQPLLVDPFSYTRLGAAWVNHSWLSEVLLTGLYRLGGFMGLGVWVAGLATLSMALLWAQMEGPALLRAFLIILASLVCAPVWSPRPQLASLVLFALLGYLLYLYKRRGKNTLPWIMPLFILWSNLHGGYALGLLLLGAFIAGEVANRLLLHPQDALSWKQILALLGWTVLSFFAVAINPNGIKMWLIPFQTVNVGALQQFIQEWASPDFHELIQQPLLWMLFLLVGGWAISRRPADGSDLASVVLFGYLAFVSRRNMAPFGLAAAPVLAHVLWGVLLDWQKPGQPLSRVSAWIEQRVKPSAQDNSLPRGAVKAVNLSIVAFLGLVAVLKLYAVTHPALVDAAIAKDFPVDAAQWLDQNHPEGRMLSSYNWGGYLIWRLPEYPVFVDGRTDLYGDEIIGDWLKVAQAEDGWQAVLERWQVRLVLIEPERPIASALASSGWKLLRKGSNYVLYSR